MTPRKNGLSVSGAWKPPQCLRTVWPSPAVTKSVTLKPTHNGMPRRPRLQTLRVASIRKAITSTRPTSLSSIHGFITPTGIETGSPRNSMLRNDWISRKFSVSPDR
jgi:hypothetical protein